MDSHIDKFAHPVGQEAGIRAIESYKNSDPNFRDEFSVPMMYASGYTAAWLAEAFAEEWIAPLKKKARLAIFAAMLAMTLLLVALGYGWSIMDIATFSRFLVAFVPGVVALIYSISKAYKTWAEAKKLLAEARRLEAGGNTEVKQKAIKRKVRSTT